MGHESPFTNDIYSEWERLLFLEPVDRGVREPLPEQVDGWQALYARTHSEDGWTVRAADAALVASMGVTIALRQRRFPDAVSLSEFFLAHPEAGLDDELSVIDSNHFVVRLGMALVLTGRVEEGVEKFAAELDGPVLSKVVRKSIIKNELFLGFHDLDPAGPADARITAFLGFLLSDWPGLKRRARRAVACKTNGDVFRLLDATYPIRANE